MLGLSEPRQSEQKSSNAAMNFLLVWRSFSMRMLQAYRQSDPNFVAEFLDGLFPFRDGGRREFQKESEDFYKVVRIF